ncbi:MAG TPA: universal stress protein [Mucilaginibacter sp.]|jgi:nucleotide-binding universal stress UspA family protein|nr:universal stress protein [Mucilaginibacter sp.]
MMTIQKILIAIDDSRQAEHAAEYGFDIARTFNAAVGLVNIVEPAIITPVAGTDPMMGLSTQGVDEMELLDIQKSQSENIVDQTIKKFAGDMPVTHFTDYGSTTDGIVACAKEFGADLIVIGTHNRHGLGRLLMGSVAEHVVRHSHVPVLVVPLKSESQ